MPSFRMDLLSLGSSHRNGTNRLFEAVACLRHYMPATTNKSFFIFFCGLIRFAFKATSRLAFVY